jgi:hypothetical protein
MCKWKKEKFFANFCIGETHATRKPGLFRGEHAPRVEFI